MAIKDINVSINKGEIVGLLGPNGAGKTTLIKLLTGILEIKSGEMLCLNKTPYKKEKNYLKNIGVVMGQKSQLIWDLPAMETLRMLKEIYEIDRKEFEERLEKLLRLLNLKEKVSTPVRKLSLGERIKFELTCSLIHKPQILFLDEPTIGLDITSQYAVYDFLREVNRTENIYYFPDSDYGVEYLNNNFSFLGTKIDLSKENNYISYDFKKNNFLDMIKFFEFKKIKEEILASNEIHYIGDGITNSELVFSGKDFFKVLEFLFVNIPEHHYFFDMEKKWCLLIATEGWIAYGEKSIKE